MIVVLRAHVFEIMTRECGNTVHHREIGTGILRESIEFLFFEARGFLFSTGELGLSPRGLDRLRSASLQADLSLKV